MSPDGLASLFAYLESENYVWSPLTPDNLIAARRKREDYDLLSQLFGLGLEVPIESVRSVILDETIDEFARDGIFTLSNGFVRSLIAVSKPLDFFVIHDHWPPKPGDEKNYAHVGFESGTLVRILQEKIDSFLDKTILDLGCSSGLLSFELASVAKKVCGIDVAPRSIQYGRLTAEAHRLSNTDFFCESITSPTIVDRLGKHEWDIAVFNPPLVIPTKVNWPHRDGGSYGIAMPLKFLDFAASVLRKGGEIFCFCTNPIVNGRSLFFEELKKRKTLTLLEKRRAHSHFNQKIARKEDYEEKGISQVELWFLHLKKN